jgi:hypothetical protein
MSESVSSRRTFITLAGVSFALLSTSFSNVTNFLGLNGSSVAASTEQAKNILKGLRVRGFEVKEVRGMERGALSVELASATGESFHVDVCSRDDRLGAPKGPASTKYFDLFVSNKGDGSKPTMEAQGLAVMDLGQRLQRVEHNLTDLTLHTMQERPLS